MGINSCIMGKKTFILQYPSYLVKPPEVQTTNMDKINILIDCTPAEGRKLASKFGFKN